LLRVGTRDENRRIEDRPQLLFSALWNYGFAPLAFSAGGANYFDLL